MSTLTYKIGYNYIQPTSLITDTINLDVMKPLVGTSANNYLYTVVGNSGVQYNCYSSMDTSSNTLLFVNSSSSTYGIAVTSSKGKAKKVSIQWSSPTSTIAGATIEIYGSNTQYLSSRPAAYGISEGTLLGSLTYSGDPTVTQTFNITGDYYYIYLKGAVANNYISKIEITWEPASVPTEQYRVQSVNFYSLGTTTLSTLPQHFTVGIMNAYVSNTSSTTYQAFQAYITMGSNRSVRFTPQTGYTVHTITAILSSTYLRFWRINTNTTPNSAFMPYTITNQSTGADYKYTRSSGAQGIYGLELVYQVNS